VDIVSKGGNYLLNVGPTAEGEIPLESIERLKAVGNWMAVNGDAIYGTIPVPCRAPSWGRLTQKGDQVFILIFEWPEDGKLRVPIMAAVDGCHLLADAARQFKTAVGDDGLAIELSGVAPDPICSVVVLDVAGTVEGMTPLTRQSEDGKLELLASEAKLLGNQLRIERIEGKANIGYWTDDSDSVEWKCVVEEGGEFLVEAEVATLGKSQFTIQFDSAKLVAEVDPTRGYDKFQTVELGRLRLPESEKTVLSVKPNPTSWQPINLRRLLLTPVE
jgi:alpha-L-fucosidase